MAISTISITPKREDSNDIKICTFGDMKIIAGSFTGNGTNSVSIGVVGANMPCLVRDSSTGNMSICYIGNGNISAYNSTLPNGKFSNNVNYAIIGVL